MLRGGGWACQRDGKKYYLPWEHPIKMIIWNSSRNCQKYWQNSLIISHGLCLRWLIILFWYTIVHGIAKSQTWLSDFHFTLHFRYTHQVQNGYLTEKSFSESESESHSVVSDSLQPCERLYSPWNSPGQNTGVGSLSLLQRIFPTQESNPGLLHYRWILFFFFFTGGFFTSWAIKIKGNT